MHLLMEMLGKKIVITNVVIRAQQRIYLTHLQ